MSTASSLLPIGVKSLTNPIRNGGRSTDIKVAEALETVANGYNASASVVNGLAAAISNFSNSAVTFQEQKLTTSSTTITPSAAATIGALLVVVLVEDATGSRQIVWQSPPNGFKGVTADTIDTRANMVNLYLFVGRSDNNWWLLSNSLGLS